MGCLRVTIDEKKEESGWGCVMMLKDGLSMMMIMMMFLFELTLGDAQCLYDSCIVTTVEEEVCSYKQKNGNTLCPEPVVALYPQHPPFNSSIPTTSHQGEHLQLLTHQQPSLDPPPQPAPDSAPTPPPHQKS